MPVRELVAGASVCLLLGAALSQIAVDGRPAAPPAAPSAPSGTVRQEGLAELPATAQASVSGALGAADAAYRVSAAGDALDAASPAQRLRASFGRSGVLIDSGALRFGLTLRSIGLGTSRLALGAVTPRSNANRVLYARGALKEWYVNGPLGLEQGFTLARKPGGRAAGPLTLSMALTGNAHATLTVGGQSITLARRGGPTLRYGALLATDASGRRLPSWLELGGGSVLLRVDLRAARYPLRIDPLVQQGEKLSTEAASGEGLFGFSVALSGDGRTALVGAHRGSGSGGGAWIFSRSGSSWSQQGPELTGSEEGEPAVNESCVGAAAEEAAECGFGRSVALSADGSTALVGGPADHGHRGAVWVFTRSGSTWSQQGGKLVGGGETAEGYFGRSIAVSGDGDTVLVGGSADHAHRGAAWVFTRSGSTWSQQGAKLVGGEESGEGYFGRSVALAGDGSTALIGGPGDTGDRGAAWVFTRSGSAWSQQGAKLIGEGESGPGRFGYSVALSADGGTALVGGRVDGNGVGAAWTFARSGAKWTQQGAKLTAGEETGDGEFGYSVALSGDGAAALIGGPGDAGHLGAAWTFVRAGSTWTQQGARLVGMQESGKAWFGASAALSADGRTALIGGFRDDRRVGAVWTFLDDSVPPPAEQPSSQQVGSGTTAPGQTVIKLVARSGVLAGTTLVLPSPTLAVTGDLAPLSGRVRVRLPGSKTFVDLLGTREVPFGTIVDATRGKVSVITARRHRGTQTLTLYAGEFKLTQRRNGLVTSTLRAGDFSVCPKARPRVDLARASARHASGKHVVRRLWAEGHGSYSTKGNYATGAVLGTRWLTEDLCEGTLIRVVTDKVAVTDLLTHRRLTVKAGHSYLVRAPRVTRAP